MSLFASWWLLWWLVLGSKPGQNMISQVKMLPSSLESCLKKNLDRAEDFVFPGEHCGVSSVFTFLGFFKYFKPSFLTPMAFPHTQTSFRESKKCDFHLKLILTFTALLQVLNTIISVLWHQHNSFWGSEILLAFLWCSRNSLPPFLLPLRRNANAFNFFGMLLEGPPYPLPATNVFMQISPWFPSPGQTVLLAVQKSTDISC